MFGRIFLGNFLVWRSSFVASLSVIYPEDVSFLEDNDDVMAKLDYAEELKSSFDMKVQSEAFCFNHTHSIESSACEYHNIYYSDVSNDGKVKMDFHPHF